MKPQNRLQLIKDLAKKRKSKTEGEKRSTTYARSIIHQVERISKLPCDYVIR
jgi:hypothetical protein